MNKEGIRKRVLCVCGRLCSDLPNAGGSYSRLLAVKIPYITPSPPNKHTHTTQRESGGEREREGEKCRISHDEITLYGKENYLSE
jgi:hypothetical protein